MKHMRVNPFFIIQFKRRATCHILCTFFIFKYIFDDFHFDGYVQLVIITNYQVIDNNQLHIVLSNW